MTDLATNERLPEEHANAHANSTISDWASETASSIYHRSAAALENPDVQRALGWGLDGAIVLGLTTGANRSKRQKILSN